MSMTVTTTDGSVDTNMNLIAPGEVVVTIGEYKIPLDHFCVMATHFLSGGFFGWNGETPQPVQDALSNLFVTYRREGPWIRKGL